MSSTPGRARLRSRPGAVAGYAVTFEEFDGGHEVPPEIWRQALRWFQVLP